MTLRMQTLYSAFAGFLAASVPTIANAQGWSWSWTWSFWDFWNGGSSSGGSVTAPELDPASAASAIALLVGAALVLHRSRRTA